MPVTKFKIGLPDSTSTPQNPVLSSITSEYMTFQINPRTWDEDLQGGNIVYTLSGNPKVSSTRVGHNNVSLNFQKMTDTQKQLLDAFINRNTTLVLVDDSSSSYEIVIVPGSYRKNRRRTTFLEQVTWEISLQVIVLN